jgi:8-oxo-dGTP pyrophosphatase MutT (NUDIX family)
MAFIHDDARRRRGGPLDPSQRVGSPRRVERTGESVRDTAVREAREETGLEVVADSLVPVGYERFHQRSTGGLWQEGRDLLQVYAVRVPGRRPPMAPELDDTSDRRWVTWDELVVLCSGSFWWPLVAATLSPPRRVSSRARFSRAVGSHASRACPER